MRKKQVQGQEYVILAPDDAGNDEWQPQASRPTSENESPELSAPQVVDLGPFEPPRDFEHGEEFEGVIPRPIPKFLRQGSHGQRHRGMIYSCIALGIMFIIFWPIPFVQGLSFYILPLKWLHWIGLGVIGLGVWTFLSGLVRSGRFGYVRNGQPFVGRVLDCQKMAAGTADVPAFQHVARVEFLHPETNQHQILNFPEPDTWPAGKATQYSCTLQPGEYLTLVHLPERKAAPITLYGFLGLDPEREYILKKGEPIRGTSPFSAVMIAFLIAFIVLIAMAAFDVVMFSFPISGDWKLPVGLAIAGLVLGGIMGRLSWKRSTNQSKSEGPVAAFLGMGILGAITLPLGMMVLNSRLDFAETKLTPVRLVEFWETTHNFVIRDYEVEYKSIPAGELRKQHLRFSQVAKLYGSEYGVAEVSPGRFRLAWVKGIHPVQWMPIGTSEVKGPIFEVRFVVPGQGDQPVTDNVTVTSMVPVIQLSDNKFVSIPEELIEPEVKFLQSQPSILAVERIEE